MLSIKQFMSKFVKDWRIVAVFDIQVSTNNDAYPFISGKDETIYYQLFESKCGKRRVGYASTMRDLSPKQLRIDAMRMPFYNTTVVYWLNGRYVPDVLTYDTAEMYDIAKKLSEP